MASTFNNIVRLFELDTKYSSSEPENSTTKTKSSAQSIDHATAIGTVASYDTLDFTHDSQTLAGKAGDMIEVYCVDGDAWKVSGALVTDGNDPDSIAIINAS